ncbi:alpha-amylase family glycosyl hydrolase [Chryseolinea sp. H1M3-3]|uniref:DUF4961 domain-containing protein n=1 Tax=Chryseolinea sp. H1M3-3 TaxID=3034144 RepID=UPI0023EAFFCA|nr:alpha-amylase family glycosyl hydrolase [Chryseolinea sp. H1M3-3]
MKKILLLLSIITTGAFAQVTVTPSFPTADEEITIVYDATRGTSGLVGAAKVFIHAGVILSGPTGTGWENVQGDWGNPGAVGEMTSLGNNKWQIKLTPRTYFNVDDGIPIYRIGMVFRSAGPCGGFAGNSTICKEGKSSTNTDIFIDLYEGNQLQINLTAPDLFPIFKNAGETIEINAIISKASDIVLKINGIEVLNEQSVTSVSYSHTVAESPGTIQVVLIANDGTAVKEKSFSYVIRSMVNSEQRPAGIIDGINYSEDPTSVTLSLWAPLKSSVYVIGDFTGWEILPEYLMKKDGEHFWLEINGLTEGEEYAYQFLVDEALYIADPYADKILDPDDQYIPVKTYPNLKPFPPAAKKEQWYFNRTSVLQTGQQTFEWETVDYEKPKKENLVIYELLVRDFFEAGERSYQNLIDTIGYFKKLGVNAIELMPVTEFNGNESWGYNPAFMFAPDKYYGTKNKLKEFIDRCHAEDIAVILDVVMNQQDLPNPYVLMYYDFNAGKPSADNPWFNQDATHPFNVFFDLNHESAYTQQYLDTVNYYWIHEYKFDGYRFDLSKGFTQKNSGSNVSGWGQYDASRIAILKRMADKIWSHSPDAYVILEHFADNTEEKELAEYRADEGKGMLLWGNYNNAYSQNVTGNSGTEFSSIYHANRSWSVPHLIGYMESHDEERLMYRNLQNGKSAGSYSVKDIATALDRIKAASLLFFTIPGPKMIWQFGELGYDQSINRCGDGSISDGCRVSPKPIRWDYREDEERYELYTHVAELIRMRNAYDVFTSGTVTIQPGTSLVKQIGIKNSPYTSSPADATEMNVQLAVNFDVTEKATPVQFAHPGTWYEYYTAETIYVTGASYNLTLAPGEYKLYTDYPLKDPVTSVEDEMTFDFMPYPNPVRDEMFVDDNRITSIKLYTPEGKELPITKNSSRSWNLAEYPTGLYIIKITTHAGVMQTKIIKR